MAQTGVRLALILACATQLSLWLCSGARADEPPTDPSPAYRLLVSEALSEFEAGRFAESRALFLRAHALSPSARTLRGLGLASFELREYPMALTYLEQALASEVNPLEGELRTQTSALLERAHTFVGRYHLTLEPEDASLRVDGVPTEPTPRLVLDIGSHVLEAEAEGHEPLTRMVRVMGGEEGPLRIRLVRERGPLAQPTPLAAPGSSEPVSTSLAPAASSRADDESGRKLYKNPWLWTGVAVAVVAAGTVAGVLATRGDERELESPTLTGNTPSGAVISALAARR